MADAHHVYDERPKEPPRNFNMTMFTIAGTPLPLSSNETLEYVAEQVTFSMKIGGSRLIDSLRYYSFKGTLFLTNFRLLYNPGTPSIAFGSFFAPICNVAVLKERRKKVSLGIVLENGDAVQLRLGLLSNSTEVFASQVKRLAQHFAGTYAAE